MKFLFISILISITIPLGAQCPTGPIAFTSQAEVNAFATDFPSCTVLPDGADVEISGADITDLSAFSQLTEALGAFEVRDCPLLNNLNGLQNIHTFGNDALDGFILRDLPALTSISSLGNLNSITGEFTIRTCASLVDLTGLGNLETVNGSVIIRDNSSLTSLNGLNSLFYIGETLELVENISLTSLIALSNVDTIIGGLEGGVFIEANTMLTSLEGLGNDSTFIGGNLDLLLNGNLELCAIPSICKYLDNPPLGAIITVNGNLTGCNTQMEIEDECATLSSPDFLDSDNDFVIYPNPVSDFLIMESKSDGQISIYNSIGVCVNYTMEKGRNEFYLGGLKPGVYHLVFENGDHFTLVKE